MATAAGEKDVAIDMVGEQGHQIDPAVAARAVRKMDWFFIPAMTVGYGLVYYDKAILGSAALFGMTEDLQLSVPAAHEAGAVDTRRLSWATSLFYFGMLAGLYPMSYVLQRFAVGRVLGLVVCVWALVCMLTAAVRTPAGLYAQRFSLGFVESAVPTGFMTLVAGFYTQREQALRQGWWFSATGLWTIIGGALNYAFAQITAGPLRRWQYIYLLAGALTFLFGLFCFAIPSSPVSAWFLTPEERFAAVERLRHGQTGVRCTVWKWAQLREGLLDAKIWLLAVMMASAYTVNGAVSGFGPLIVRTFGWNTLESILFQFPLGGLCFLTILLTGWLGSRHPGVRIPLLIACCLPVITGCALIWKSEWSFHAAAPVVGYSITGTFGAVVSLIITIGMSNVAGHTKKSFTAATIFVAYCVGNIVGPQLIRSQTKAAHYPELWLGLIICYCITILASVALWVLLRQSNRQKEKNHSNDANERAKLAFQDLSDKENPFFRMWLINTATMALEHVMDHETVPYAILSHLWEDDEVTFGEFRDDPAAARRRRGYRKIDAVCRLARHYTSGGLPYAWVDTCCIDKTSSAELSEAINSMYKWYAGARICFAYISDLAPRPRPATRRNRFEEAGTTLSRTVDDLFRSRWFTRGWTLQELIAPARLTFLDVDFGVRGSKMSLRTQLAEHTGIDKRVLSHAKPLAAVHVARRMAWAARRRTTRREDAAYCLMGLFDINMPLLYGEGDKAFLRLQEEICRRSSGDLSLFAWTAAPPPPAPDAAVEAQQDATVTYRGILAQHPSEFLGAQTLEKQQPELHRGELSVTNKGIRIDGLELLLTTLGAGGVFLRLNCMQAGPGGRHAKNLYIRLEKTMEGYVRADPHRTFSALASSGAPLRWLPPDSVYIAAHLSEDDRQRVARQRSSLVRFVVPPPAPGRLRLRAAYPRPYWDPVACASMLDDAFQQEGVVGLEVPLRTGGGGGSSRTSWLALAWSCFMDQVQPDEAVAGGGGRARRGKKSLSLKHVLVDEASEHWEAVAAALADSGGGRALGRRLRYDVLDAPGVNRGLGAWRYEPVVAGGAVGVSVRVRRPDPPNPRVWIVELDCDTSAAPAGDETGAAAPTAIELNDDFMPHLRPAATY